MACGLAGFTNFTPMLLPFLKRYGALLLLLCALFAGNSCFAQHEGDPAYQGEGHHPQNNRTVPSIGEKLFSGGDLGAWFGNVTYVNASPILGYWITEDELVAGIGLTYQYYNNKDVNFSTSIYGGSAFLRYYIGEAVFAQGQYEVLNVEAYDQFHDRVNVPSVLLGGGYSQAMGENSSFVMLFLWNFSESRYTPYSNPVIRAGFNFGL